MTRRMLTLALIIPTIALLGSFEWATPTEPQPGNYQGRSAEWWAGKTTHWKRAAVKRGRTLAFVKRRVRSHSEPTLSHGIALAAVTYGQSAAPSAG